MKIINRKLIRLVFTAVFFLFLSDAFCADAPGNSSFNDGYPEDLNFWSDCPSDILAKVLVNRMTDSELFSQILMFGWAGAEPTELLNQWVTERGLGSVKVFGWNTDDINLVAKSIKALQQKAQNCRFKVPLFVATDQEGGWIRHVKGNTSETPGNLALGADGYPIDSYYTGFYIGREMRTLGINMNFAPAVDLYSTIDSTVIGPRSFGEDPEAVGILGAAWAKGSMDAGVIPTAKHFPGHGDTGTDSHGNLPVIDIDLQTLEDRELLPFKKLVNEDIPAIMSGHLSFPRIITDGAPASLSETFLYEFLRKKLGYTGLIITDDMMMNGATLYARGLANAVGMAVEAGNEIVISSTTPQLNDALWTQNFSKMKRDPLFKAKVKSAAEHVIRVKLEYFKSGNAAPLYPDADSIATRIPDPAGKSFFLQQACRSISLLKKGTFPYTPDMASNEKVLIAGQFFSYGDELKKRYPDAAIYSYKYYMNNENLQQVLTEFPAYARRFDTIIVCVANAESAKLAESLKRLGKRVIIVSILAPKFVVNLDWADTILLAYSYSDYSFKAAAAVLAGEIPVYGELPLSF